MLSAFRADDFLFRGYGKAGRAVVPVGAAMAGEAREHQAQAVQEFGPGAESGTYAGHSGPLMQCDGGRHIKDIVHIGLGGETHPPAGICGQRVQIPSGAFGIQHSQGKGRLAAPAYSRDPYNLPQRDVNIYIFKVMDPRATHFYAVRSFFSLIHDRLFQSFREFTNIKG